MVYTVRWAGAYEKLSKSVILQPAVKKKQAMAVKLSIERVIGDRSVEKKKVQHTSIRHAPHVR